MSNFSFPNQTAFYSGKVRDVYSIGTDILVMIASNRLSAFDVILPKPIPYKGQVLTEIAAYMLYECKDICPNWLLKTPAANVSIGKKCEPFAIEMVVRGNLTGHAWRTYNEGKRTLCGITMLDGMKENDFFPNPIITPSSYAASPVTANGSAAITFVQNASLEMVKSANQAGPLTVGMVVTYSYLVRNTGNVTISAVTASDVHNGSGPLSAIAGEVINTDVAPLGDSTDAAANGSWDTLRPGDTIKFTATYTVTQTDIDTL